jgi:glycosyltransferase involved in cell wall biosynthesis
MKIACFLPTLHAGGAERVTLTLAEGFARRGHAVSIVLGRAEGELLSEVSPRVRVVDLGVSRVALALVPLALFLRRERPDALVATMNHVNVVALAAAQMARTATRVVVSEASSMRGQLRDSPHLRARVLPALMRRLYPRAAAVVAVCRAAAEELESCAGVARDAVHVVYNPVDFRAIREMAARAPAHPWLNDASVPVVLAAGRLSPEKGFDVLLRAVHRLPGVRALILGEGAERAALERCIDELSLRDRVALPGFDSNPYAAMQRCSAFALPSRWEGLPTALIEAVSLGAPAVASESAGGAREILDDGRWGALVPSGDVEALAGALHRTIAGSRVAPDREWFERFDVGHVVERYLRLVSGA